MYSPTYYEGVHTPLYIALTLLYKNKHGGRVLKQRRLQLNANHNNQYQYAIAATKETRVSDNKNRTNTIV